ncbi:uncharacterized protein LOC132328156 [Haemorhous mexicanus]|uniref:uncharacterized protein LOC132328156 n=1 Tax=Haemorhous mexicanus TaxID=30427 RepID=UPI0028BE14AE|nr:uncharacterized protein LOC132328156 [Haemorhous mexicanus]
MIPTPPGYTNTVGDLGGISLRPPERGPALRTGWPPPRDLNRRLSRRPAVPQPDTRVWNESALPSTPPRAAERLPPPAQQPRGDEPRRPSIPGSAAIPGAARPRHAGSCSPLPPSPPRDLLLPDCGSRRAPRPARRVPRRGRAQNFPGHMRAGARPPFPALPTAGNTPRGPGPRQPPPSPLPFPSLPLGRDGRARPHPAAVPPPPPPRLRDGVREARSPRGTPGRKQGSQQSGSDGWGYVNKSELLAPQTQRASQIRPYLSPRGLRSHSDSTDGQIAVPGGEGDDEPPQAELTKRTRVLGVSALEGV